MIRNVLQLFTDVTHLVLVQCHKPLFGHLPEYGQFGVGLCGWIPLLRKRWSLGDFTTSIPGSEHQPKHGGERGVVQNDANLKTECTPLLYTYAAAIKSLSH